MRNTPSAIPLLFGGAITVLSGCGGLDVKSTNKGADQKPRTSVAQLVTTEIQKYSQRIRDGVVVDNAEGRCSAEEAEPESNPQKPANPSRYNLTCKNEGALGSYYLTAQSNGDLGCEISTSIPDANFPPISIYATGDKFRPSFRVRLMNPYERGKSFICDDGKCNFEKTPDGDVILLVNAAREFCAQVDKLTK